MSLPEPPDNVRLMFADGAEIGVECFCTGLEGDLTVWQVTANVEALIEEHGALYGAHFDKLPAKTTVRIPL